MKKGISILIGCILFLSIIFTVFEDGQVSQSNDNIVENISEKLIRFHVLANSNSDEDQVLKMKVKDEVISFISPKLENSKSLEESRKILKDNNSNIIEIANKIIKENGYNYTVTTTIERENFPEKIYGNIVLPQGEYEAFRILIGKAQGENWWCVMFPPLCFVDITKGQVSYDENIDKMKDVLSEEELDAVTNNEVIDEQFDAISNNGIIDEEYPTKIIFKFKLFEFLSKKAVNKNED